MWDLPRPRIESVSPAVAGGFFTTERAITETPYVLNKMTILYIPFWNVLFHLTVYLEHHFML